MKVKPNNYFLFALILFAVLISLFLFYGPYTPSISGKCGIESCHGLEITCGPNVPEVCTEEYALGDKCRQYVSCGNVNGQCQLIKDPKFDECKACVEKCLEDFKNDPVKTFDCESKC